MHYYEFNIKDWLSGTSHLSPLEEGIYLRLVNYYYDKEEPISNDIQAVCRKLRLLGHEETAASILEEFFNLKGIRFHSKKCDGLIKKYKKRGDASRENGKQGGRPRNTGDTEEPTSNLEETQQVNLGSLEVTQAKANHKPLTNNHKLITIEQEKNNDRDLAGAKSMYRKILLVAEKTKEPNYEKWANDFRLMRERDGLTHEEIWKVFMYANNDSFWSANILSPKTLRAKFAKLHAKMGVPAFSGQQRREASPEEVKREILGKFDKISDRSWADGPENKETED